MKDLVQRVLAATSNIHLPLSLYALHQNLISEQAHKHVAPQMDVYLFAYSLSQQITGSVVV